MESPQFRLELKNDKLRFYRSFAVFLFMLNFVGLGVILYQPGDAPIKWVMPGTLRIIFILVVGSYLIFRGRSKFLFEGLMIIFAVFAACLGYWWIAALDILLLFLYRFAVRLPVVEFNRDGLRYPSFPTKLIPWNELENVVVKEGLLTIDLRNNRLIQQMLASSGDNAPNETEINEFCRARMEAAPAATN